MASFKTLKDFNFVGKRVIVRVGMDIPVDKVGTITNDKRIKEGLPTLKFLLENKVKQIIILNHLGRPKNKDDKILNHDKLALKLSEYLKTKVVKLNDCIDIDLPSELVSKVVLLENVRFHKEETENNDTFSKKLAANADCFVSDAFSVSHRAQSSVVGITKYLPSCAGLLLEKEIKMMGDAINNPKKPFVVILGGAKVSDKLSLIKNLLPRVDRLLLGGAMIFTFYKAQGLDVGKSIVEDNMLEESKKLLVENSTKIKLPDDIVIAEKFDADAECKIVDYHKIDGWMGLDIGPNSILGFQRVLFKANTIVWNGPLGVFEFEKFARGTNEIAKYLALQKDKTIIIGGGDTASAIEKLDLQDKFTHISTGGGASLEFLEGKVLPGIKALEENTKNFN